MACETAWSVGSIGREARADGRKLRCQRGRSLKNTLWRYLVTSAICLFTWVVRFYGPWLGAERTPELRLDLMSISTSGNLSPRAAFRGIYSSGLVDALGS